MPRDLVVRGGDARAPAAGGLVEQPDGEAGVEPHEEHLLHDPHAVAEALGRLAIGEGLGVDVVLGERAERLGVDDEQVGVLGGVEGDVERDHGQDARGGEHTTFAWGPTWNNVTSRPCSEIMNARRRPAFTKTTPAQPWPAPCNDYVGLDDATVRERGGDHAVVLGEAGDVGVEQELDAVLAGGRVAAR